VDGDDREHTGAAPAPNEDLLVIEGGEIALDGAEIQTDAYDDGGALVPPLVEPEEPPPVLVEPLEVDVEPEALVSPDGASALEAPEPC